MPSRVRRETLIKAPIMSSVHVAAWCQSGHRFDLGSNVMARVQGKPCKIWPGRIVTKRDHGYTVLLLGLGETVDIADVTIWVFCHRCNTMKSAILAVLSRVGFDF